MADVERGAPHTGPASTPSLAATPPPRGPAGSAPSKRPAVAFQIGQQRKLHEMEAQAEVLGSEGLSPDDLSAHTVAVKEQIKTEELLVMPPGLIHPYNRIYRAWWWVVIGAAVVTGWLEPYQIAFLSPTPVPVGGVTVLQYVLLAVFAADMVTSCFVGYYDNVRGGGGC
ncbi:hypothetical protein MNEG_10936 [Monoraphidium neglectum]|uniref:Uncharacterized protein n=1 Tax=Monoraphidium neglectum TaxID=145388 RepID=A0A0D2M048_9CHLO|nr:hypothetical protein MNEG_10936 [Monoraphidium neglectum]KIY97024.1 hypothetical protein MNEG_10936 [Monoraphidium neglectum]|eukprot:XP_013896044.1 hypothetical protein MNEG_10936 [Monoraphidium neglectum]